MDFVCSLYNSQTFCAKVEHNNYGIASHTFDIILQLKLFKFTVNYFLRNIFVNRHGVTASFHTNESAGTQTPISALLTCTSEIKNVIQNNMYTGLIIVNVHTLNYQRVVN